MSLPARGSKPMKTANSMVYASLAIFRDSLSVANNFHLPWLRVTRISFLILLDSVPNRGLPNPKTLCSANYDRDLP